MIRRPPRSTLFPYTTLFPSRRLLVERRPTRLCLGEPRLCEMGVVVVLVGTETERGLGLGLMLPVLALPVVRNGEFAGRSEEHTSELQSQSNLACRLLLEKKQ